MNIKIIADSTCDLPKELIQKHNIRIAPLGISLGDKILQDGVDITSREIFEYVESGNGICKTSAVNVAEYTEVYQEERPKCDAIIHFIISADMSSCYQNARIAAADFDNIFLVDSRNLSCAIGHLVLDAIELVEKGMAAEDIYREITARVPLLDSSFVIDTLSYLHKGGRCSTIQALASSVLKIKPSIVVAEGKMTVGKKYRGKLESVLRSYVTDKLSDKESIDTRRLFIANTLDKDNIALVDMIKSLATEILPFQEVYETIAGGTISCHCGPNTVGIFLIRNHM